MSKLKMRTRVLLGLASLMTIGGVIAAPSASAAPCAPGTPGQYVDGFATEGQEIPGSPKRYEFGDSPYVGVRYDKCLQTIKVYFGGYTGITHYNISPGWGPQLELAPLERGVWTAGRNFRPLPPRDTLHFSVQACKRGGFLGRSTCTAWSPVVWLEP